jgi:hypothetical protein
MRKWRWIGHTLRKGDESTEKQALDWNPQKARRGGRPKETWKRTVLEGAENEEIYGARLRSWRATESDGDASQLSYVPNGTKGYTTSK